MSKIITDWFHRGPHTREELENSNQFRFLRCPNCSKSVTRIRYYSNGQRLYIHSSLEEKKIIGCFHNSSPYFHAKRQKRLSLRQGRNHN